MWCECICSCKTPRGTAPCSLAHGLLASGLSSTPAPRIPTQLGPTRPALRQTISQTGSLRYTRVPWCINCPWGINSPQDINNSHECAFLLLMPLGLSMILTVKSPKHLPHWCTSDGGEVQRRQWKIPHHSLNSTSQFFLRSTSTKRSTQAKGQQLRWDF